MPYLHFIETKLDSKSGKIKGLDVTFQMHIIAKIFDIIKYLKNKKKSKIKKKEKKRIGKITPKGTKRQKGPIFLQKINPQNKTKKMSISQLNSVQWLERYSW